MAVLYYCDLRSNEGKKEKKKDNKISKEQRMRCTYTVYNGDDAGRKKKQQRIGGLTKGEKEEHECACPCDGSKD